MLVAPGPGLSRLEAFLSGAGAWETGLNSGTRQETGSKRGNVSAP